MGQASVTIFTPTYNREKYIGRLYESLCNQQVYPKEWIVLDDGNDGTGKKINEWKKNAPFPIRYVQNTGERGIHRSFNKMAAMASGTMVMKVDDDDYLLKEAIRLVIKAERSIQGKSGFAGVSGLRGYEDGTMIGDPWKCKRNYVDATNLQRAKYSLRGDKAEAYYLSVLRKYLPFPEYTGEYYTWEGLLWDRISHAGYKLRWFHKIIYITEYLPGGASANVDKACIENFNMYTKLISEKLCYKEISLIRRMHMLIRYYEVYRKKIAAPFFIRDSIRGHYLMCKVCQWISYITVKIRFKGWKDE